jgi:hypothetical protein
MVNPALLGQTLAVGAVSISPRTSVPSSPRQSISIPTSPTGPQNTAERSEKRKHRKKKKSSADAAAAASVEVSVDGETVGPSDGATPPADDETVDPNLAGPMTAIEYGSSADESEGETDATPTAPPEAGVAEPQPALDTTQAAVVPPNESSPLTAESVIEASPREELAAEIATAQQQAIQTAESAPQKRPSKSSKRPKSNAGTPTTVLAAEELKPWVVDSAEIPPADTIERARSVEKSVDSPAIDAFSPKTAEAPAAAVESRVQQNRLVQELRAAQPVVPVVPEVTLAPSPSAILQEAIVATRGALRALAAPASSGASLPLDLSRQIFTALRALAPVESLPIQPVLRPASAVKNQPAARAATARTDVLAAEATNDVGQPSLHELENLNLALSLLPRPAGRKVLQVGRASFGRSSPPVHPPIHPITPPTLHQIHDLGHIISLNLDSIAHKLSSRPGTRGGAQTNEILQEIHSYATTAGMGRDRSPSPARPTTTVSGRERSPTRGALQQPLSVSANTHTQPKVGDSLPLLPPTRTGVTAGSIPSQPSGSVTIPAAPFSSMSAFATSAALIPVPSAPAAGETVNLSSGETIQGWGDDATANQTTVASSSKGLKPSSSSSSPNSRAGRNATAVPRHLRKVQSRPESRLHSAVPSPRGTFDLSSGIQSAFEKDGSDKKAEAAAIPQLELKQPSEPAVPSNGYVHSSTIADDFEWHMPEHQVHPGAARRRVGRSRRRGTNPEVEEAFMPLKRQVDHFSPISYSRALRQVVETARTFAFSQVEARAAALEAELKSINADVAAAEPLQPGESVFTPGDHAIKGWVNRVTLAIPYAEEKSASSSPKASPRTMMMLLANGGLDHVSLEVATSPISGSTHYQSPYLPPAKTPTAAGNAAGINSHATTTTFPYEVQSAQFAALAATFNAHPSNLLSIPSARPRTAERWETSGTDQLRNHRSGTRPVTRQRGTVPLQQHYSRPSSSQMMFPSENAASVCPPPGHSSEARHCASILQPSAAPVVPLVAPPRMRAAAGVGSGVAWSFNSTPSIPRARFDLMAVGDDAQPVSTLTQTPAVQAREVALWASRPQQFLSQPSSTQPPIPFHPAPPEPSRFGYAPPFYPVAPEVPVKHQHALGPRETQHVFPPANVNLAPHVDISHTGLAAGSLSARAHRHVAAALAAGNMTARVRSRAPTGKASDQEILISATTPFYPPPPRATPHPATSRKPIRK